MLRKELDQLNKQLAELRAKAEGFTAREAELETAINEAETDEERNTVSEAVEAFENEREEVTGEIAGLEERVSGIESELEALEENQDPAPAPAADPEPKPENRERGFTIMNKRNIFRSMDVQTRDALFAREDVANFLTQVRTAIKEKRAITGGGLLVQKFV